jgi:CRP-like cAMP-binding protein
VSKRSTPANNLNDGAYRLPHNFNHQSSVDYRNPRSAEILRTVHEPSIEPEQPYEEDVIDQLFNSSEKRLARLLLLLANYGKEGNPPIVPVILSQETLAEMIGTTRSRVSFFMNKFRRLGLIDYNGKIDVHQSLLNSVLHDKPEIREAEPA